MVKAALCRALLALAAVLLVSPAAFALAGGKLIALASLEPGLWQLRDLDNKSGAALSICASDPAMLMQVRHRGAECSHTVIANGASEATVHYSCPGKGFGRTSLRVETPRLVQIETQGISDQLPFASRYEARRTGACR